MDVNDLVAFHEAVEVASATTLEDFYDWYWWHIRASKRFSIQVALESLRLEEGIGNPTRLYDRLRSLAESDLAARSPAPQPHHAH